MSGSCCTVMPLSLAYCKAPAASANPAASASVLPRCAIPSMLTPQQPYAGYKLSTSAILTRNTVSVRIRYIFLAVPSIQADASTPSTAPGSMCNSRISRKASEPAMFKSDAPCLRATSLPLVVMTIKRDGSYKLANICRHCSFCAAGSRSANL